MYKVLRDRTLKVTQLAGFVSSSRTKVEDPFLRRLLRMALGLPRDCSW